MVASALRQAQNQRYYANHKDLCKTIVSNWRDKNRNHINELQRKYDAKKKLWRNIVKEFNRILLD